MAEAITIARPYAEAAFRLAQEASTLDVWAQTLAELASAAENEEVAIYLSNPALTPEQKANLLQALAEKSMGTTMPNEAVRFLRVLADNARLIVLPEIKSSFDLLKAQAEGVKVALIKSAFDLSAAQIDALIPALQRRFCPHGEKLQAQVEIDVELIGGIRVMVGDEVLEASVRGQLDAMSYAMNR